MSNYPTLWAIIIGTKDAERAKQFYINVFWIIIEVEKPHYISAKMQDGTHIEIEEDSENRFPNREKHNIGTYKNSQFMVDDLEGFLEKVIKYWWSVVSSIKSKPRWSTAEIADPEGNMFLIGDKKNII